jgi:hypothetical protein
VLLFFFFFFFFFLVSLDVGVTYPFYVYLFCKGGDFYLLKKRGGVENLKVMPDRKGMLEATSLHKGTVGEHYSSTM